MGKDVGESRVVGSQAKKPADQITDWQKEVTTKWNTSLGKGAPVILLLFTSRNTVLIDPPHPLLPAQTERKATWFSCQRGNKPLVLEKASRTRRKKTDPRESSVANKVKSTQTKNEREFLFSSRLVCWFLCLWKATLPHDLFPFVERSFILCKTNSINTGFRMVSGVTLRMQ